MSLYSKLDGFLKRETWHTGHALDEEKFYVALAQIIRDPHFNADDMGEYICEKKNIIKNDDGYFSNVVEKLVIKADAVRDFIKYSESV